MTEKEQLRQQVEEAWNKYYKEDPCGHCGPGNGCDDCRGCEDNKVHHKLYDTANKLQKKFKKLYGHEYDEKVMSKKDEFEKLYWDWIYSFGVSAFGCSNPAAQEPYAKLREWCKNNKEDALKFIKEILEDEPNDIVMILQDLYGEEHFKVEGFMPLEQWCNIWLNILNCTIKKGKLKDYYKDYRKWKKYLDKHYMSWRPNLENDPNVTQQQYSEGQRNGEERRSWHDFSISILTDAELLELYNKGYITNPRQMFYIEELKTFYDKVKEELHKRGQLV